MGEASLHSTAPGKAALSGSLDFASVPLVWSSLCQLLDQQPRLQVSLAGVSSSNSAALALLLEAQEHAAEQGGEISFTDLPQTLIDLAQLSNVTDLLADSASN